MPARRRRLGSETEQQPLVVITGDKNPNLLYNNSKPFTNEVLVQSPINNTYNVNTKPSDLEDILKPDLNIHDDMNTSRDRTNEFGNAVRYLLSYNNRAITVRDPRKAKFIQSHSEFMSIAKTIGKNIASTYTKLEKLTLLAKQKSLFNDRSSEIQELTYIIKGDLGSLNQQIAKLQEISKSQNQLHSGKHLKSHTSSVVLALQSKLASMSTDFKSVLEVRTENLKQQKHRRDQFSQGPISNTLPPSVVQGHYQGSVLLANEQVSINMDSGPGTPLLSPQQQQQQQMMLYDETDNYLQNRAETMQNIESTIVELGGIFQQLAHMVKEQEEMVERIDTNVQDAELNIEAAHGEILKYFQSVTSNRWLMIKIFAVLIAFFIFFVVFVA
ncbi:syntaxin-5 [Chrysoperla carnea]|uniref:syntaxin-5 n=1 Tax=Chrysoperla carnea TaxID=189513 RepID=UPI001D05CEC2|nr:syntaxin-5 [Chrysoperla carnea]